MKKILILGAGLAGLAAGVRLASGNNKVILFEASPKAGGRAYSRHDTNKNFTYDNGQHLMMSCYDCTLQYLKTIGTYQKLRITKSVNIPFLGRNGESFFLQSTSNIYPFNLLSAITGFNVLGIRHKIAIIGLLARLKFTKTSDLENLTVSDWFGKWKVPEETIKSLWEILVVGTLNASLEEVSAASFATVLKEIFLNRKDGYKFIVPGTDLSDLFVTQALDFIQHHQGEIYFTEKIIGVEASDKKIVKLHTTKGSYQNFDYIISAVPYFSLAKILPEQATDIFPSPAYNPIISVHIKTDTASFGYNYYALLDSPVQWVFVHENHISIVISNAGKFVNYSKDILQNLITDELECHFPFFRHDGIEEFVIIKEKRATFVPTPQFESERKNIVSPFENLILAGDWTNTGLPSTIESAVKSGFDAAETISAM